MFFGKFNIVIISTRWNQLQNKKYKRIREKEKINEKVEHGQL